MCFSLDKPFQDTGLAQNVPYRYWVSGGTIWAVSKSLAAKGLNGAARKALPESEWHLCRLSTRLVFNGACGLNHRG